MPTREALDCAVTAGIISADQAERLQAFWNETSQEARRDFNGDPVDTEAPHFLRGFHDVLITIGLTVGLAGLAALFPVALLLPAIWLASELFVARQRLALPALFLALFWTVTAFSVVYIHLEWINDIKRLSGNAAILRGAVWSGIAAVIIGVYFARFRIPITLAGLCSAVIVSVFAGFGYLAAELARIDLTETDHWFFFDIMPLLGALSLFVVASSFDLSDRLRTTRRSDVAFWLHMVAAPALLLSVFNALGLVTGTAVFLGDAESMNTVAVFAVIFCFVAIGLLLDRRAFITSGLLSLGVAIGIVVERLAMEIDQLAAISALLVGLFVLLVAVSWNPIRRAVISRLPKNLADRLPPPRGHLAV